MANKCWPAFQTEFGFVPCYVNSRLTAMGIPTACEVDIYGALSEFIGTCVTGESVTLLDINNSVPADMYKASIEGKYPYRHNETFMGFHCGNTPMCRLVKGTMKYQLIMKRSLEPDKEPDITRGTLEGDIVPGPITFYRLQANKGQRASGLCGAGRDPARGHRVLRRHRRVRHPGDEPLLPPCADRRRLSAPRRGGLRPSRQGPDSASSRCWAWTGSATTSPRACFIPRRTPSRKERFPERPSCDGRGAFRLDGVTDDNGCSAQAGRPFFVSVGHAMTEPARASKERMSMEKSEQGEPD